MILLGLRHALDVDHISAIDNLVRLHNATRKSRWVGGGFSIGHMISVLAEMILIIYVIGNITRIDQLSFWKRWGKTSSAILASKVLASTGVIRPFSSALLTGMVFGLGFDTATQILAITLSAVASATIGIQMALVLAGFFAAGMIPVDTLNSFVIRSAFSRIFNTRGFKYMTYALSTVALTIAAVTSYETITSSEILPDMTGPILAITIISVSFGSAYITRKRQVVNLDDVSAVSPLTNNKSENGKEDITTN